MGGPSSKAKYSWLTDSEPVLWRKGEKNPCEGSEIEPETLYVQAVGAPSLNPIEEVMEAQKFHSGKRQTTFDANPKNSSNIEGYLVKRCLTQTSKRSSGIKWWGDCVPFV